MITAAKHENEKRKRIYKYFWNEIFRNERNDENSIIAERSCEQFQYLPLLTLFFLHGSENSEKEKCEPRERWENYVNEEKPKIEDRTFFAQPNSALNIRKLSVSIKFNRKRRNSLWGKIEETGTGRVQVFHVISPRRRNKTWSSESVHIFLMLHVQEIKNCVRNSTECKNTARKISSG